MYKRNLTYSSHIIAFINIFRDQPFDREGQRFLQGSDGTHSNEGTTHKTKTAGIDGQVVFTPPKRVKFSRPKTFEC
jgi:hypothetical protein